MFEQFIQARWPPALFDLILLSLAAQKGEDLFGNI